MRNAQAVGLALLAIAGVAVAFGVGSGQKHPPARNGGANEVLGWKVENGRYATGPYKGYLAESPKRADKVVLTDEEWKKRLTPSQYKILRGHGTEAAFCGAFHDNHMDGVYKVAGIDFPVFKSSAKFDSGTGWPSFFQPFDMDSIWLKPDFSYGMVRMEVLDAKSDSHLGHVFEDGPREKTGLRFCINSDALVFTKQKVD